MTLKLIKDKKDQVKQEFSEKYPKFKTMVNSRTFWILYNYIESNKFKMIWAIEDLDSTPLEGIGKKLVQLKVDFNNPDIRRLTGAIIAYVLSDEYMPEKSGCRVSWPPFITASKYKKK